MNTVRRSLALSFVDSYVVMAIQFATSLVIARLLTPDEIGVFSVAVVVVSIAHTLRDFGITSYLIKEPTLDERKLRAASALSFATSWPIAVVLFAGSFALTDFYREPRLLHVLWVLAFNFVLIPFGAIVFAVLRRELRMGKLFVVRLASTLASAAASIALALAGHGPMALALSMTVNLVVSITVVQCFRPPGLMQMPGWAGVRDMMTFARQSIAGNVAIEVARAAPDAVLGRVQDMAAVGFYGRATGLVDMFGRLIVNGVWSVTLPYFARVQREGGDLVAALARTQTFLAGLAVPFYVVLGLAAHPVVRVLYGAQWTASVPVLQLLCAAGAFAAVATFAGSAMTAADRMDTVTRLAVGVSALRIVVVAAAAPWGIVALAAAICVSTLVELGMTLAALDRALGMRPHDLAPGYAGALGLAGWSALPGLVIHAAGAMDSLGLAGLVALAAASVAAWLAGAVVGRHPYAAELARLRRALPGGT